MPVPTYIYIYSIHTYLHTYVSNSKRSQMVKRDPSSCQPPDQHQQWWHSKMLMRWKAMWDALGPLSTLGLWVREPNTQQAKHPAGIGYL